MFEVAYFAGNSIVMHKALVFAVNEVIARGLIREHEKHVKITVVSCNLIPDNSVYKVF